eukprot:gene328-589_t
MKGGSFERRFKSGNSSPNFHRDSAGHNNSSNTDLKLIACELAISLGVDIDKIAWPCGTYTDVETICVVQNSTTWRGLTCEGGYITGLQLSNSNLRGTIPSSIYRLNTLTLLDLSHNDLNGTIPITIFQLTALQILNISNNHFIGSIPSLAFTTNTATTTSSDMGIALDLFNGDDILLSDAKSSSSTSSLSNYYNITDNIPNNNNNNNNNNKDTIIINLSSNSLQGSLPVWIFSLHKIRSVSVAQNHLNGTIPLPSSLSPSKTSTSTSTVSVLSELQSLDLSHNAFSQTIPSSLCSILHHSLMTTLHINVNVNVKNNPLLLCIPQCLLSAMNMNKNESSDIEEGNIFHQEHGYKICPETGTIYGTTITTQYQSQNQFQSQTIASVQTLKAIVSTVTYTDLDGSSASFYNPEYVAIGPDASVYISDSGNNRVRKISPIGKLKTIAGDTVGTYMDLVGFVYPMGLAVDSTGKLFVVDNGQDRICRLTISGFTATVTTIAGSITGGGGRTSYDGQGTAATFNGPYGIAIGTSGALFVTEYDGNNVRKIDPSNNYRVTTIVPVSAGLNKPTGIATDGRGNVLVLDDHHKNSLLQFSESAGVVSSLNLVFTGLYNTTLSDPYGITARGTDIIIADSGNEMIRVISANGIVYNLVGSGYTGLKDGTGSDVEFDFPEGIACDASGNIYVVDYYNNKIRYLVISDISKDIPPSVVSTKYGTINGRALVDGIGTAASFYYPSGLAFHSSSNNIYVTDHYNSAIRMIVSTTNQVITIVGNGKGTYSGDQNDIVDPVGITINSNGFIYFTDYSSCKIRKITVSGTVGTVTTVAGAWTTPSTHVSRDGTGTSAAFNGPYGIASGANGALYVIDYDGQLIRKISIPNNYLVSTISLASISYNWPSAIAVDAGSIYITDGKSGSIISIVESTLVVSRIPLSFPVFDDPQLNSPFGMTFFNGWMYIADTYNNVIRSVSPTGETYAIAGNGTEGYFDNVDRSTMFAEPVGIIVDQLGNIVVADAANDIIRYMSIDRSTDSPSSSPSYSITTMPTYLPIKSPTNTPSRLPTQKPSVRPSRVPTSLPSTQSPSVRPSGVPTSLPSTQSPSVRPSGVPTSLPSTKSPSVRPSGVPTSLPSTQSPS